jgi:RNA polymerase sigma-70 factor (ECF subfamily)
MKLSDKLKIGATRQVEPAAPREAEHLPDLTLADDETLVARVQNGDSSAFDLLVDRYKERLYATVYHMTSNHEDANDLVQEAFIKAYKSLGTFKRESSFYTWVYRIAVNRTINHLKRRKNRNHFSLDDIDAHIQSDPDFVELMSHVTPRREVGLMELQEKLNEALQKLSEPHRTVVVMHDVQGMTHADIAKVLKCSEGTVRSRLFYARQQLQGLLSDYL